MHLLSIPPTAALHAQAWGEGADWVIERAPGLAGLTDDDRARSSRVHDVIRHLHRRMPGVRLTRTDRLIEALIPAVLEQKVTGMEARRAYRRLTLARRTGTRPRRVCSCHPTRRAVAALPYHAFHPFGLERRRAETLRFACAKAPAIEALAERPAGRSPRTTSAGIPGIGEWTAAEVARLALGDADAVSVGDYHLPNMVAWALAGEPRGTDERMLELLRALPRTPRPGAAAVGGRRHHRSELRPAHAAASDRTDLTGTVSSSTRRARVGRWMPRACSPSSGSTRGRTIAS